MVNNKMSRFRNINYKFSVNLKVLKCTLSPFKPTAPGVPGGPLRPSTP